MQYNKGGLGGGDAENLEERQRCHVVTGSAAGIGEPRHREIQAVGEASWRSVVKNVHTMI